MIHATGILARAEKPDLFDTGLMFPLIALGVFAVAGVLILVLVILARSRLHPNTSGITSAAILWGFILSGSVLYVVNARLQWSKERSLMLQSGDIDTYLSTPAPAWPWTLWIALAVAYAALAVFARRGGKPASGEYNEG